MENAAKFRSISYGFLTQEEVFDVIVKESAGKTSEFEVMIGTDSQGFSAETKVVAVIVLNFLVVYLWQ